MIVSGMSIPQEVIDLCEARMRAAAFQSYQIEGVAERAGIPGRNGYAMRLADRLIQKHRKAGNIVRVTYATWQWKEPS